MSSEKMSVTLDCYATEDKVPKAQRAASVLYLPLSWSGKKVRVLLLEPIQDE